MLKYDARRINKQFFKVIRFKGSLVEHVTKAKQQILSESSIHTRFHKRMINKSFVRHPRYIEIKLKQYSRI